MSAQPPHPELKAHLQKVVKVKCNGNRIVYGTLVGYDHFMNLSLVNVRVESPSGLFDTVETENVIIRGATVLSFEAP